MAYPKEYVSTMQYLLATVTQQIPIETIQESWGMTDHERTRLEAGLAKAPAAAALSLLVPLLACLHDRPELLDWLVRSIGPGRWSPLVALYRGRVGAWNEIVDAALARWPDLVDDPQWRSTTLRLDA